MFSAQLVILTWRFAISLAESEANYSAKKLKGTVLCYFSTTKILNNFYNI